MFGGGNLVSNALADYLPLELCKGQKHIEGQTPHARCRIEGLGDRNERDLVLVKEFDELGKIRQ